MSPSSFNRWWSGVGSRAETRAAEQARKSPAGRVRASIESLIAHLSHRLTSWMTSQKLVESHRVAQTR